MTTPTPTPGTDTAAVDQALAEQCTSSGEYLAGLLAAGKLEAAGCPEKLPELLFPDLDPQVVERVWNAALPVGYRLGRLTAQPRWTPEGLNRLRTALGDAGYQAMGRLAARSANTLPPAAHPADAEQRTTRRDRT